MHKDKKLAVLAMLRETKQAISLVELMAQLGPDYSERSVRRWLGEMTSDGFVEKLGQKKATRYRAVTQNSNHDNSNIFSKASLAAIAYVQQPLFERKPVAYNPTWLEQYKPNRSAYLSDKVKKQLICAGQKTKKQEPEGTYARHIYNRLLIDLSYNSSRLEGNTYSLIDTKRLIIEGASATGKLNEETIMILNHKEAIRYLVDNANRIQIDPNEIGTIHFLLSDALIAAQYAGKVRDYGVRISGSTYIPFENPSHLQKQLKIICEKAALIDEPYEQSFFLLVHIAYLQAFLDVNKRTARLSANLPLIKQNLVPLSFNDIEKEDYVSAMIAIYELNNVQPLLELYVHSYLRTCHLYDATIEAIGFDEIRVRYRQQRRDILRHIILNELIGEAMQAYIDTQTKKLIETQDQADFLEDVAEDLTEIAPQRIAGLGITVQQLNAWLQKQMS